MPSHQVCRARLAVVPAAVTTFALGMALPAHAESDPYYFGINQLLGHSSNVYNINNQVIPDKYETTSLNFGFDQPISRQRVFASVSVRDTRYEDIKILNNTGYGLNAGWNWETIERLSGGFGVSINKSLANYAAAGDQQQVAQTKRNEETSGQANMRVQYGLASLLSANASLSHSQVSYTAVEYDRSEVRQNAGSLGLTYRPSGLLTLGAALRVTRGEYPNIPRPGGGVESFDRKDLDLTATWVASGLSTINTRLSYGRSAYDSLIQRNTKGATGSISWAWQPTGKLSFNTSFSHDTGTETSLLALANSQSVAVGDNSVTTDTLGLSAGYEATAKIRLNLGARYAKRKLVNDSVSPPTEGRDTVTSITLGATYAISRAWQMGCNAGQDTGKPTDSSTGVSTRYTTTNASCNVQFTIR